MRIYVLGKNERSWKVRNVTGKNQVGKFESKVENF